MEYAALCAVDDWAKYVPKSISIEELIEVLLPNLLTEGVPPAVFCTPVGNGVVVDPGRLLHDLNLEAAKYE